MRSVAKHLPMEFVVSQKIDVRLNDEIVTVWYGGKRLTDENTEGRGEPVKIEFELTAEMETIIVDRVGFHFRGNWKMESDAPYTGPWFDDEVISY